MLAWPCPTRPAQRLVSHCSLIEARKLKLPMAGGFVYPVEMGAKAGSCALNWSDHASLQLDTPSFFPMSVSHRASTSRVCPLTTPSDCLDCLQGISASSRLAQRSLLLDSCFCFWCGSNAILTIWHRRIICSLHTEPPPPPSPHPHPHPDPHHLQRHHDHGVSCSFGRCNTQDSHPGCSDRNYQIASQAASFQVRFAADQINHLNKTFVLILALKKCKARRYGRAGAAMGGKGGDR